MQLPVFADNTGNFIEHIHSLNLDEIQELDLDIKINRRKRKYLLEVENVYELLTVLFSKCFIILMAGFLLTNGLLIIPESGVPEGEEKINLKQLYEMFKDTNFNGLVSLQFLLEIGIFFGFDVSIPKRTIKELYKNLSYEIFRGARVIEFDAVSDLVEELSFKIKRSTLSNRDKEKKNKTKTL